MEGGEEIESASMMSLLLNIPLKIKSNLDEREDGTEGSSF
jgi:hypothetical protein